MNKSIKIAVIQMNASPAPVQERLARAEYFVIQCAEMGAQLVVLPEVFNTGYEYSHQNYLQAEPFDSTTANWMRLTSTRYHIHLAGSFLRRAQNDIFNTLLLVAPDGRQWHYDKNYPWIWERAYFQKGTDIAVADTDLGKIGFLICWDVAHPNLWQKYANKVELMIVSSCAPKALDLALVFPNGQQMMMSSNLLTQFAKRKTDKTFGEFLRRQASSLGVPVAQATSTGVFTSPLPNFQSSLMMFSMMYPSLLKYRSQFEQVRIESNYFNETYVANNTGDVLQSVAPEMEGFAISEVLIPDFPPQSIEKQPAFGLPRYMYLIDSTADMMFGTEYNKNIQRYFSKPVLLTNNGG